MRRLALGTLPLGTAWTIWTGIGVIGSAAFGVWLFGEPAGAVRAACFGPLLAGVAGRKPTSGA